MEYNEKQLEILDVAEQLFAEYGFDGTSVRDISKKGNINVAMVSYYFGSKENLLFSLINYRIESFKIDLQSEELRLSTAAEKMDLLVERYLKNMNNNRKMYKIVIHELSQKKKRFDIDIFNAVKDFNINLIDGILQEGEERGEFVSPVPKAALVHTLLMGTYVNFYKTQNFLRPYLGIQSDAAYEVYSALDLTHFLKRTIKSLLLYEN